MIEKEFEQLARIEEEMNAQMNTTSKSSFNNSLEDRFEEKPWLLKHRETRGWVRWLSLLFQFASIVLGFYGTKVMMESLPLPAGSEYVGAAVFLFTLEFFKRKYSDRFWDSWYAAKKGLNTKVRYSAGAINIVLLCVSIFLSGAGVFFMNEDFGGAAKIVGAGDDPEAQALVSERSTLRGEIEIHRKNKNSAGEIYWPSQESIALMETSISTITQTLKDKHGVYDLQNVGILEKFQVRAEYSKYSSVGFTLLFEILFEICMAFMSLYDVRVYIGRKLLSQSKGRQRKPNGKKQSALAT